MKMRQRRRHKNSFQVNRAHQWTIYLRATKILKLSGIPACPGTPINASNYKTLSTTVRFYVRWCKLMINSHYGGLLSRRSQLLARSPWWDVSSDDEDFPSLAMPRTTTFTRPYDPAMHTKITESGDRAMKKFAAAAREPISDAELGRLMLGTPYTVIRPDLPIDPLKD